MLRVQSGDLGAFEQLVERYQDMVYGLALSILRSPEDAEEAAQDAFLKLFRARDQFDATREVEPWLLRIAGNACRDRLRRRRVVGSLPVMRDEGADALAQRLAAPGASADNAAAMQLVVAAIVWQAWQRLHDPRPIDGALVSAVASAGLLVNLGVAWLLVKGHHNLNTRSAFLHVVGDALGSVAAIAAGLVVWTTGWRPIDPLLSVLIAALVLVSSVRLVREALHALLDGVPSSVSAAELRQALSAVAGVQGVHDLHIWALSGERVALSAHVRVDALQDWPLQLAELQHRAAALGIDHATFQPELQPCPKLSHCA